MSFWMRLSFLCLFLVGCSHAPYPPKTTTPPPSSTVLKIKKATTKNGVPLLYVYAPEVPMVDVRVVFDAGSARDGKAFGLANLTGQLLQQGSRTKDAHEVDMLFDDWGANFNVAVGRDRSTVFLQSLSQPKYLTPSVALAAEVLQYPGFKKRDFDRMKKQQLTNIQVAAQSPGEVAKAAFYKTLYGKHPYGHSPQGTTETVKRIQLPQVTAFYKKYYVTKNALVVVVGDVSLQQATSIAQALVGKLPQGHAPKPLPIVPKTPEKKLVHVNFPSSQTHILIGEAALSKGAPDFFPLYVGNQVLGGSLLTSRLYEAIRNQHGYAYSVYSYLQTYRQPGPFIMALQTRNEEAGPALSLLQSTFNEFLVNGPTPQEVNDAKQSIIRGFPLAFNSDEKIADAVETLGAYQLPLTFWNDYQRNIAAVTPEKVRADFKKHIQSNELITVIVGPHTHG